MRCLIRPEYWMQDEILLDEEESHHLLRVLRIQPGQIVETFDGAGRAGTAEFAGPRGNRAVLRARERRERSDLSGPPITLIQALPREQKMDWIIQKATELGVAAIQPILTANCVARIKEDRADSKLERWRKIALNAAKQSGTPVIPAIEPPLTLKAALADAQQRRSLLLIGALTGPTRPLRDALRAAQPPSSIAMLVGPEGDFTPEEQMEAIEAGACPVSFGSSVLRSETAALFAICCLRYEFGRA